MFIENFKSVARLNKNFRKVLYTGTYSQVVAMSIPSGGEIGEEIHPNTDQVLLIASGGGEAVVDDDRHVFAEGDLIFVPAGIVHNILNTGNEELKLITFYAPPEHADGEVQATKE